MDINVLLHFIEHVGLGVIMNQRRMQGNEFHDLLLPRSWILYGTRVLPVKQVTNPSIASVLAPIRGLLTKLYHWDGTGEHVI